jgi:hypothetical protein
MRVALPRLDEMPARSVHRREHNVRAWSVSPTSHPEYDELEIVNVGRSAELYHLT